METVPADQPPGAGEKDTICCHCASPGGRRWGVYRGRQRYRCGACRRTWTAASSTPVAGVRKRDEWEAFVAAMVETHSIRSLAAELGVTPRTVQRWRSRMIRFMGERAAPRFSGSVQLVTWRPFYSPWLHLMVLMGDDGAAACIVLPGRTERAAIADTLRRHIAAGSEVLMGTVGQTMVRSAAESAGFTVHVNADVRDAYRYSRTVNTWRRQFYGVDWPRAYLAWFDAQQARPDPADFLGHWLSEAGADDRVRCDRADTPAVVTQSARNTEGTQS